MNTILLLKSSLSGDQGNSSILANALVEKMKSDSAESSQTGGGLTVITRDLAADDLPHLTQAEMASWANKSEDELATLSNTLINELKSSDTVVIAMPMYNFGVPSTFKAWVDRIARAGVTFQYTENGPVGLLENKKIVVVAARGGIYEGTPVLDLDYAEDSDAETDLNVIMTASGGYVEVQGTAEAEPFTPDELNAMLALAQQSIGQLSEIQQAALAE